ncbi:hypothetical protein GDO81_015894 [Engystomops pustulosus]|uniref:Zinc finger protein 276 n=1 Tax=Engystomops pustulosus TaxID=76066 RepID=A0AAV7AW29_ENGPU|nr:hypothetical protein GDO81_015894 [Engystomops pustulosus]
MKRDRRRRTTSCLRRAKEATQVPAQPAPPLLHQPSEPKADIKGALSTGYCRLCHGKFSSRSLRQAFGKVPVAGRTSEEQKRMDQVFFVDFQQLVGVSVRQDPRLPQYVCKDCHAQFYKCRSVLRTFIQRVNISPITPRSNTTSGKVHNLEGVSTGPCAGQDGRMSPQTNDPAKDRSSDLSDCISHNREDVEQRDALSSDDYCEPYPKKRPTLRKTKTRKTHRPKEPRERKKPGPKPGWKKIKREREELPTIFKCPYQGCTAVYRGADGMKKHIKEHHEEVRERPCPHPGCNKVFMIDRYLQRHVKLIHTDERNYICDQCGQAFKQRKHLSVHQMRHSGAKPLQCEVCGFQCRQRASLKYHMTKHKAEADLEFACDQCGKRFEKAHNLNVHMSMVHPLTQSPAKPPDTEPDAPSGTMEEQAMKADLAEQLPN